VSSEDDGHVTMYLLLQEQKVMRVTRYSNTLRTFNPSFVPIAVCNGSNLNGIRHQRRKGQRKEERKKEMWKYLSFINVQPELFRNTGTDFKSR